MHEVRLRVCLQAGLFKQLKFYLQITILIPYIGICSCIDFHICWVRKSKEKKQTRMCSVVLWRFYFLAAQLWWLQHPWLAFTMTFFVTIFEAKKKMWDANLLKVKKYDCFVLINSRFVPFRSLPFYSINVCIFGWRMFAEKNASIPWSVVFKNFVFHLFIYAFVRIISSHST